MSVISTVAVDFVANVAKYTAGLKLVETNTKKWSDETKKQTKGAEDAFNGVSRALTNLAKQALAIVTIQKISSGFADVVKNAALLADEAQKVGASVAQFSALDTAARKNGASIVDVKNAYKELQKSINEANTGTKDTIKAFSELGVSYSYISTLTPDERFLAVAEALKNITDENKRAEIGTKLLGRSYTELVPIIEAGREGIANAARESATAEEIQKLDKLNKEYEKITQTIKLKFTRSVVELYPYLTTISDGLIFIIKNLESLIKVAAFAFSPVIIFGFSAALAKLSVALGGYVAAQTIANNAALFFQTTLLRIAIPTSILTGLGALAGTLKILAAAFAAVSTVASVVVAGVAIILASFLLLFKAFALGNELLADTLEFFGASAETIKHYRDKAIYQNEIVSASLEELGKKFGFAAADASSAFNQLTQDQKAFNQSTNDASLALDKEAEMLIEVAKREMELSEAIIQEMATRAKAIEDSVMTPSEVYQSEIDKIREVFQSGVISYETYQKAIAKLARDAAKSTVDLISTPSELVKRQILEFGRLYTEGIITLEQAQRAIQITTANAGKSVTDFIKTPIQEAKQRILDFSVAYVDGFISIEEATAATEKVIKEMGQGIVDYLATPADEVQKKIANIVELYQAGFISLEQSTAATEKVIKEMGQSIVDYLATPADEVKKRIANIVELYQAGFISLEQSTAALAKANVELWEATNPKILKAFEYMSDFADQFSRAIAEGQSFGDALSNVFKNILRDITALILKTTILQGIMEAIGFISPTSGAAQAFGKMTGLIPRAEGGPVSMGNSYRIGERGPETFVPSSNGYILPNDMGTGEVVNVYQTINVQTGVSQTVRAEMFGLLPRFKQEAMAGVLDAKQRGGSYAKGLAGA